MDGNKFFQHVMANIDLKAAEIIKDKPAATQYLTYWEFKAVTARVRGIFSHFCGEVPSDVEVACTLSEAIVAPTNLERVKLLKAIIGIAGTGSGITLILVGIGHALGWGAGVIAAVTAWFTGHALLGPIGWIVCGVSLIAIAAYFAVSTGDPTTASQKAVDALKESLSNLKPVLLEKYGTKIEATEQ
jgi:hypothetical protein